MIVRRAAGSDTTALIAMGRAFYATTSYAGFADYSPESAAALVEMMRETGVLLVAEHDGAVVGMVGMVLAPFLFNHAHTTAHEVMWWVNPEARNTGAGAALLRAIAPACKEAGASAVQMMTVANSPPQAAALYERAGYTHTESSFTRVL